MRRGGGLKLGNVVKVKYFTKDKIAIISQSNLQKYKKYLQSCIIRNKDVKDTTYKIYENYFTQFLVYLAENWDNVDLYSEDFMDNAVDIMEGYMSFCQDVLLNHKKNINTKLSAVSSFYIWSAKRGYVKYHPFQGKLDRMKGQNEEHIIDSYFLSEEQVRTIRTTLAESDEYDIQDQLLFEIAYNSANRIGALERLTISSLSLDEMVFTGIREKEGYIVDVVFEDLAKELIEEWISMRQDGYDKLSLDAFFITKHRGEWHAMSRTCMYNKIKKYGTIVGINNFRPHCIRKSRLNNIYEETGDLSLAADLANHKSTETTRSFYTKKRSKSEVRDKINALRNKAVEEGD